VSRVRLAFVAGRERVWADIHDGPDATRESPGGTMLKTLDGKSIGRVPHAQECEAVLFYGGLEGTEDCAR
jgi:hypothetical protein